MRCYAGISAGTWYQLCVAGDQSNCLLLAAARDCCLVDRLIGNAAAKTWTRLDMMWSACGVPWTRLLLKRGICSRRLLLLNRLFRYGLLRKGMVGGLQKRLHRGF